MIRKLPLTCLLIVMLLGLAEFSSAKNLLYRYRDNNDDIVLGSSVPPEFVHKGYQIVDAFGRVVREVPPALTPEQIAEQERLEKEHQHQEELKRQQDEADRTLMKLYSHPDDARRARDRRLQELDTLINLKTKKIEENQKKIVELESKAADVERAGKKVPDQILADISRNTEQNATLAYEVADHQANRDAIVLEFTEQIERLEFLLKNRP